MRFLLLLLGVITIAIFGCGFHSDTPKHKVGDCAVYLLGKTGPGKKLEKWEKPSINIIREVGENSYRVDYIYQDPQLPKTITKDVTIDFPFWENEMTPIECPKEFNRGG